MTNRTRTATAYHLDGSIGDDTLIGLDTRQNVIYGGAGADLIRGGARDDILVGDAGGDTIAGGAGDDAIWAGGGNDSVSGGDGDDYISGGSGQDTLVGGAGADTMAGGIGSDIYYVDDVGDVVQEEAGQGNDVVYASIDYALPDNVEKLVLVGNGNINAVGNALDDLLMGNSGNNVLDGAGGADRLVGGAGNDTYVVENTGDVVIERPGEGIDTVNSSISYSLGANVENLILTGSGAIDGTGNGLDNRITGNASANLLIGGLGNDTINGGEGGDTLAGGDGSDALNGAGGRDRVFGGAGNDTIWAGGADDRVNGNDGDDRIYGDGGRDVISGGAGSDTMTGGQQNGLGPDYVDTYLWARADLVDGSGGATGLDHITDFGAGDRLDFTDLFATASPPNPADVIRITDGAGGIVVSADVGGGTFVDIVVLDNVHGLTLDDLVHNHQIIV